MITLFFVTVTRYTGEFTVELYATVVPEDTHIEAKTPFGRKVEVNFSDNKAAFTGFYKEVRIVSGCKDDSINEVCIGHRPYVYKYSLHNHCKEGICSFAIPVEKNYNIGFFTVSRDLVLWVFTLKAFQNFTIIAGFAALILFSYFIFRSIKRAKKNRNEKTGKKIIHSVYVFGASLVFWILIILFLSKISLRIFGSFYSEIPDLKDHQDTDSVFTILCIGDSFTFGIGAPTGKSYPEQLKQLIEENEKTNVRIINAGVCAGNTTQMLENVQPLLRNYKPDAVVMLFGMANSWNYYGFSNTDNFLYQIKIYKLFKRIVQNISYQKNGFEMWQKADDFAIDLLTKTAHIITRKGIGFNAGYYSGRYCMARRDWKQAISRFAFISSIAPPNDSVRNALWVCTEGIDTENYFSHQFFNAIDETLVPKTIELLDSLIEVYHRSIDLKIVKYRYLAIKGDTASARELIKILIYEYPDEPVLFFDLLRFGNQNKNETTLEKIPETSAKCGYNALIQLKQGDYQKAKLSLTKSKKLNPKNKATYFIELAAQYAEAIFKPENSENRGEIILQFIDALIIQSGLTLPDTDTDSLHANYITLFGLNEIFDKNRKLKKLSDEDLNNVFLKFALNYYDWAENMHDAFSLIHNKKRSKNLRDQEVFTWISSDINIIIDICMKQSYQIICMNYPLIPPPNSEEISYWAAGVGDIWKQTAKEKNIAFVNQDSLFSLWGNQKEKFFEPAFTGSEHCNEKGYGLMAENIYKAMKEQGFFKINKK